MPLDMIEAPKIPAAATTLKKLLGLVAICRRANETAERFVRKSWAFGVGDLH